MRRRTRRRVLPHPLTDSGQTSNDEFFEYCGRHLASLINLIDFAHLIVVSNTLLITHADFMTLKAIVKEYLLPIPNRTFAMRRSTFERNGIAEGAALFALHRALETRLNHQLNK